MFPKCARCGRACPILTRGLAGFLCRFCLTREEIEQQRLARKQAQRQARKAGK